MSCNTQCVEIISGKFQQNLRLWLSHKKEEEDWQKPLKLSKYEKNQRKISTSSASHKRGDTGGKPHTCDVCGKSFTEKGNLNKHMRVHTGEKPFGCDACSKCFKRKSDLKVHMRIHTGEKPHSCDFCSKCFNHRSHLQSHMRVHTGEKPYRCDVCNKCFNQKYHLQTHMSVHTESTENPFLCAVCSRSFSRKTNLQSHMSVHTEEKPHKCNVCQKCFKSECFYCHNTIVQRDLFGFTLKCTQLKRKTTEEYK
uniref:C2H2-type domain-containing protein n=1 Tax=Gouania willdenowi TaxID=441366 RepID=A0A8C5GR38_GOUWI